MGRETWKLSGPERWNKSEKKARRVNKVRIATGTVTKIRTKTRIGTVTKIRTKTRIGTGTRIRTKIGIEIGTGFINNFL